MIYGVCTNQPTSCARARSRELIAMKGPDTRCPEPSCGKPLLPVPDGATERRRSAIRLVGVAIVGVALLGVGYVMFGRPDSGSAAAAPTTGTNLSSPAGSGSSLGSAGQPSPNATPPLPTGESGTAAAARPSPTGESGTATAAPPNKDCQRDWATVTVNDPLWTACAQQANASYRKRHDYIDQLKRTDWTTVAPDSRLLTDCAGWTPCEQARDRRPPAVRPHAGPRKVPATCAEIAQLWEPEDPELSTCQGLLPDDCRRIKRCLKVNGVDTGPGIKKD
jgi:hypothetical protein